MDLYRPKWQLEKRIWESIEVFYNDSNQVANLQARLKDYHRLSEDQKAAMRIGLEGLIKILPRSTVEQVTRAKYEGKTGTEEVRGKKERGYRGMVSQGISTIFDGEDPNDFLKPEVKERRDWLVTYAGILDLMNLGNDLSAKVLSFVRNVNTLLWIYNNLEYERVYFFTRKMGYPIQQEQAKPKVKAIKEGYGIKGVVANLDSNRSRLKKIKSKDKIVNDAVKSLLKESYTLSEIIFMTLYAHATTSLQSKGIRKAKINWDEWEKARLEIGKQIKTDPYFVQLGPRVKEFYLGKKTIRDLVSKP